MERKSTSQFSYILRIGLPVLLLVLPACAPQPQVTQNSTPVPSVTVAPPSTSIPATLTPAPTDTQTSALSVEGPWLLVNTAQGLWAANPDGSGGTLLTASRILIPGSLSNAVSSVGGYLAYLTTTDFSEPYGNYPNLKLNILALPGREPMVSFPLTSPATEPAPQNPSDIMRAMVEHKSFAWSPDGKRLAYIGAAQGPSADLYEYLLESGATLRLTDGPDQAYAPLWSPDGQWIAQTAAAGFGTGAGIVVTGFFAARADGSGVISLYDIPEHSGGEYGIGWLNAHTLVMQSWYITCGPSDLRLADLSQVKADLVFEGCVSAAAVAPSRGSVLFAQSPETAMFNDNPQPGLFLITDAARQPRLISDADIQEIAWAEGIGSFLARASDNRLYEISPSGDIQLLAVEESHLPTVSPNGRYWAFDNSLYSDILPGVWVGEYGQELNHIFTENVMHAQMLFSPAGDALYFLDTIGNLYRAQAPDWIPALLAANLEPEVSNLSLAWVSK